MADPESTEKRYSGSLDARPAPTAAAEAGEAETVRAAFDAMPTVMAVMEGAEHRLVGANRVWRDFVNRSGFLGRPARDVLPDIEGQQLFELLDEVYRSGETYIAHEWRMQMDTTADVFLDFTLTPWFNADGRVRGVLVSQADVTERALARQAAETQAADAERRYESARDVVAELQEALLPTGLPVLPQARIGARYLVAAEDQSAGGDWFDAIPLTDGRVALVVGDVVGHGVAASAAMGQLRAVLKHLLATEPALATVFNQADSFAANEPALRAATLCVAVLDPATGTLHYCLAGHPPPLVATEDGEARFMSGAHGGPLGTGSSFPIAEETVAPGEVLLLYSDGLIERPGHTLDEGKQTLATVAADAAANRVMPVGAAPTPAERVCQLTVELITRAGYADDVTALAVERLQEPAPPFGLRVANAPADQAVVRKAFSGWIGELGIEPDDRYALELAVSEVVTNAIEHAYSPGTAGAVCVDAELLPDGQVECRVADDGQWRTPQPESTRGRGLLLCERLLDHVQVSHGPQPEGEPVGSRGTTVVLRHRVHRPAMIASDSAAAPVAGPPVEFAVDVATRGGEATARVTGPVDIATVDELSRELVEACRGGVLPLTIELDEVTQLGSAGVRTLHELRGQLAEQDQPLTLRAAAGTPAASVLDIVGLPYERDPRSSS